ncbi:MAG: hypothetical protein WC867_06645 [Candidatus Pacearchaeota archaeon]|jgi:hypothetical protein
MGYQYFSEEEIKGINKMYSRLEKHAEDDIGCLSQGCGCGCLIMALGGTFASLGMAYAFYQYF